MKLRLLGLLTLLVFLAGCIEMDEEYCPPLLDEFEDEFIVEFEEPEEPNSEIEIANLPKKIVKEGDLVSFPNLKVNDPDGDEIVYTFSEPLNEDGEWLTKRGDAGEYEITITASDSENVITQKILIVVESINKAPLIQTMKTVKLKVGETLTLNPKVNDPNDDKFTITYSGWKTELPYTTTPEDAGTHTIIIMASDGLATTTEDVTVIVEKINRAPELSPVEDMTIHELDKIVVIPETFDVDGDEITYKYSPPLDKEGVWESQTGDAGEYNIRITASDGKLTDTIKFRLTVLPYNAPPILEGVQDITVSEGDLIELTISAEDPEGEPVEITLSGWMTSNTKQTGSNDAGEHQVTVTASDGKKETQETFTITVKNKNRPPVFMPGSFE